MPPAFSVPAALQKGGTCGMAAEQAFLCMVMEKSARKDARAALRPGCFNTDRKERPQPLPDFSVTQGGRRGEEAGGQRGGPRACRYGFKGQAAGSPRGRGKGFDSALHLYLGMSSPPRTCACRLPHVRGRGLTLQRAARGDAPRVQGMSTFFSMSSTDTVRCPARAGNVGTEQGTASATRETPTRGNIRKEHVP